MISFNVFVAMFFVLAVIVILFIMLIPQLIESVSLLVSNMDVYIKSLNDLIMGLEIPGVDIQTQFNEFLASSEDLIKTDTVSDHF